MGNDIRENNLRNVIHLCYEMLELADHGDRFREDTGCGVVYGTLRDTAYKIRQMAEDELKEHLRKSKTSSAKKKSGKDQKTGQADGKMEGTATI